MKPNRHREALTSHLEAREWTDREINQLICMIGTTALTSEQGALRILEYQQATDERIEADKQHDEVFIGNYQPTLFEYNLPDKEGEALEPNFRQRLEVTGLAQADFDRHQGV